LRPLVLLAPTSTIGTLRSFHGRRFGCHHHGAIPGDPSARPKLNANGRSLLQVKIKDVDEADDIFAKLMGDVVEPRREFIQDNPLSANVDLSWGCVQLLKRRVKSVNAESCRAGGRSNNNYESVTNTAPGPRRPPVTEASRLCRHLMVGAGRS